MSEGYKLDLDKLQKQGQAALRHHDKVDGCKCTNVQVAIAVVDLLAMVDVISSVQGLLVKRG